MADTDNEVESCDDNTSNKSDNLQEIVQNAVDTSLQQSQCSENNSISKTLPDPSETINPSGECVKYSSPDRDCNNQSQQESPNDQTSPDTSLNDSSESKQSCNLDLGSPSQPSKQRLHNTKRRAGVLYKQLKSSKLCRVSSKYFNQSHDPKKRWIPPRSPYSLVQEDLFDKPWQLLVATIFLTKTAAKRALPQLHKFLARYPRPEDVLKAKCEDIDEYFKPLGLTNTRSRIIMRFTAEFLEKDWTYPRELYGIGKYGDDSYRMFCIDEWRQVSPDDIPLTMYRNWLLENAERLGLGKQST